MNIEEFRSYCLSKEGVSEEFPFGPDVLVFKVMGKMFALTDVDDFVSVSLKCEPDLALELRERYYFVLPGYHMNKKHWNTVEMTWELEDDLFRDWIDHSYDLVVESLPKKVREKLKQGL